MKATPTILRSPFAGARTSLRSVTPRLLSRQTITQRLVLPPDPFRAGFRVGHREGITLGVIATLLAVALALAAAFVAVGL